MNRTILRTRKGENNPFYGHKHSEATKEKMRLNNAHYFQGKKLSKKHKLHIKQGLDKSKVREQAMQDPERGKKISRALKGRIRTKEHSLHISLARKGQFAGKNHPNWKGGMSDKGYPKEFNNELKERIRSRDNYTCQRCDITEAEWAKSKLGNLKKYGQKLVVNHIDFNKSNCKEENLNTLCISCNIKINYNRKKWTKYFKQQYLLKLLNAQTLP